MSLILPRRRFIASALAAPAIMRAKAQPVPGMLMKSGTTCDPNFSSVTLLCHFNGTNGQTTFTDNSLTANTLAAANATVSTGTVKFGTGSVDLTVNANSRVQAGGSTNAAFNFGAGQFTVECWANFSAFSAAAIYIFFGNFFLNSGLVFDFGIVSGALSFFYSTTGTNNANIGASYTPSTSTWIAFAVDRDASNVVRVYANGAVIASGTVAATIFGGSSNVFTIGNDSNTSRHVNGFMDEIRVTKGVARYGGAYTPATSAFPNC